MRGLRCSPKSRVWASCVENFCTCFVLFNLCRCIHSKIPTHFPKKQASLAGVFNLVKGLFSGKRNPLFWGGEFVPCPALDSILTLNPYTSKISHTYRHRPPLSPTWLLEATFQKLRTFCSPFQFRDAFSAFPSRGTN